MYTGALVDMQGVWPQKTTTHLFLCILFSFFCPVRPTLPQAIFLPKIPPFWDLRSTLSCRAKATCRGWVLGTVLDGVAPKRKRKIPFFLRAKKGETIKRPKINRRTESCAHVCSTQVWVASIFSSLPEGSAIMEDSVQGFS